MKVVFDTNVLISGFLTTTGLSQQVFATALKRHIVFLSDYILEELQEILAKKFEIPKERINLLISFLRKRTIILEVLKESTIKCSDPKDIPILNLVAASGANYFISGDKKLLSMKKLGPTLFLSPREAVGIL